MVSIDPSSSPLVSVVIPAHNAAAFLAETLDSVRAQRYPHVEIIVVDDGSADGTAEIAAAAMVEDPRVRLIRQPNGGVAAARNRGIAEASGEFIAPLDSDDLWHPDFLSCAVEKLLRSGPDVALCYAWSIVIDEAGAIRHVGPQGHAKSGSRMMARLLSGNFIGNGSAAVMRREAVLAVGGYDATLRARGGQGCEDFLLYLLVAERWAFAVVPDFLVAYRYREASMSRDVGQMLRSERLALNSFLTGRPGLGRGWLALSEARCYRNAMAYALRRQSIREALAVVSQSLRSGPRVFLALFAYWWPVWAIGRCRMCLNSLRHIGPVRGASIWNYWSCHGCRSADDVWSERAEGGVGRAVLNAEMDHHLTTGDDIDSRNGHDKRTVVTISAGSS